jgi:PIN domain nuclease of toxin-antitoxin system
VALLLDTHLLLWSLADPRRLPTDFRRELDGADVYVSAASIWEIAIKNSIGKIGIEPSQVLNALEPAGFLSLAITGVHAAAVSRLPLRHKDPFDRLLIAQSDIESLELVTNDAAVAAYGGRVRLIGA